MRCCRSLAEQELVAPSSAADQAKLANGWWDAAEKETGVGKTRIQRRSRLWYEKATPNLTGLAKVKATKRLEQLAKISDTSRAMPKGPVNLLAMINVNRDVLDGTWRFDGAELLSPSKTIIALVQIPYSPPEEYELQIMLTPLDRSRGHFNFGLIAGGHPFTIALNVKETNVLIEMVDGKSLYFPQGGAVLLSGKKNVVTTAVRDNTVTVTVNGRIAVKWRGDYRRLSAHEAWRSRDGRALWIGSGRRSHRIHSITLTPITGRGTVLTGQ